MKAGRKSIAIFFGAVFLLAGCGKEETGEEITLTVATFNSSEELSAQVEVFNETHKGIVIEIKEYGNSWQPGENMVDVVRREIALGKGPDIINYGKEFTGNALAGNYTENLLPYLERNENLDIEDFFGNILELFYYDNELHAIPPGFLLETMAGSKENLEGREGWTVAEMMQCYLNREEGKILYLGEQKSSIFRDILGSTVESYIDWGAGECYFDCQELRDVFIFANLFPDKINWPENVSRVNFLQEGNALISKKYISKIYDICDMQQIFGGREITYIGYPVEKGSGTAAFPSNVMLAISANSQHKEIAWEFIAQFLAEEYQENRKGNDGIWPIGLPIRRSALEKQIQEAMEVSYVTDVDGERIPEVKYQVNLGEGELVDIYALSPADAEQLMELIESASLSCTFDSNILEILWEESDSYFNGEHTLEETIDRIQRRAALYVSERVG